MNRKTVAGLAAVLLLPGLAFAQDGRGPGPHGGRGLPPGVWEVKENQTAPAVRPEARMLLEHLQKMSQRLDRLEQAVKGLIAERRGGGGPGPQARGPRGPQARGPRGSQAMGPRGPLATLQRGPGAGAGPAAGHPRLRMLAQRMRQNAPGAWERVRQAFLRKRLGALGAGEAFQGPRGHACPQCGRAMDRPGRGPAVTPRAGFRRGMQADRPGPGARRGLQRRGGPGGPAVGPGGCGGECPGDCGGACGGGPAMGPQAKGPQARGGAPGGGDLQAENARLRAHVQRLEAQLRKLAAEIQQLRRVS